MAVVSQLADQLQPDFGIPLVKREDSLCGIPEGDGRDNGVNNDRGGRGMHIRRSWYLPPRDSNRAALLSRLAVFRLSVVPAHPVPRLKDSSQSSGGAPDATLPGHPS